MNIVRTANRIVKSGLFASFLVLFAVHLPLPDARADNNPVSGPSSEVRGLFAPSIAIAPGQGIVSAGIGLEFGPGVIDLKVPSNVTVNQVLLYWEGRGTGDASVTVNNFSDPGVNVTGSLIGESGASLNGSSSAYRADITAAGLVVPGDNVLEISNLDFGFRSDGASVLVIYSGGRSPAIPFDVPFDIRDGNDFAAFMFLPGNEVEGLTVPQTYNFTAANTHRFMEMVMFVGDTNPNRPEYLEYTIDGATIAPQTTRLVDFFIAGQGPQWSNRRLPIVIPPGAESLVVELVSARDPSSTLPADAEPESFSWVGGIANFNPNASGVIGNRVWLDENSDGLQDAGEPGIGNVEVGLFVDGVQITSTLTDSNGGYLFSGLPAMRFAIRVDPNGNTLDRRLTQTVSIPFPGADFSNQSQPSYTLDLGVGEENLTADFGYNWAPQADVLGNDNEGALGDRVWIDSNANGLQDPGERGVGGVVLQLSDASGNIVATATTAADGSYIFDDLAAGAYRVRVIDANFAPGGALEGTEQTGGFPSDEDNFTSVAVVLAPGDVFLNVDFGYLPAASASIGDTVYFDADGNGRFDAAVDLGIPGVSVALVVGGKIVAVDISDADGRYAFGGLADGDYEVVVNDTDNVLGELAPSGDPDGGLDNRSALSLSGLLDDLEQDFGYAPPSHEAGKGLLGDTVYLDVNGNGVQEPGESGIEGVRVSLFNGSRLLAFKRTDENGRYAFGNLPAGTYTVKVSAPSGYANTADPFGAFDSESEVAIGAGDINLEQDFGYRGTGVIGTLVWEDLNADGVRDAGEGEVGIENVSIDLYLDVNGNGQVDPGEPRIANTVTGFEVPAGENYLFEGIAKQDRSGTLLSYIVDVSDSANILNGYWHSLGDFARDNHSQDDPYCGPVVDSRPGNLAVYLAFEDGSGSVAADAKGNSGVLVNMDNSDWVAGLVGGALDFDGVNDRVDLGDFDVDGTGLTLRMLVKAQDFDNLEGRFISKAEGINGYQHYWMLSTINGTALRFRLKTATSGTTTTLASATGELQPGVWYDIAATYDESTGVMRIYKNGVEIASAAHADGGAVAMDAGVPVSIGHQPQGGDAKRAFKGLIDEVQIYDVALSAEQLLSSQLSACGTPDNRTADFGYYIRPAGVGNFVWNDLDGDGVQDKTLNGDAVDEPGIAGVTVNLTIDWPNGAQTLLTTVTDDGGIYSFDNLLLDENMNGLGTAGPGSGYVPGAEANYIISVDPSTLPAGAAPTQRDRGGDDTLDSDGENNRTLPLVVRPIQGTFNETYDFGYIVAAQTGNIAIEKFTNGQDADLAPGPYINVGDPVTWTYEVTNTGNVPLSGVTVFDDINGPVPIASADLPVSTGLVVRFEADSGITTEADGTTVGTPVTGWSSNGGTGLVLQASGGATLGTTPNGQTAIRLDGTDGKLESAANDPKLVGLPAGNAARTMYFVVDYKAANGVFVGATYGTGALNQAFCMVVDHGTDRLAVSGYGSANDFTAPMQNAIGDNMPPLVGDDWFVQSVRYGFDPVENAWTFRHYRDGLLIDTVPHEFATLVERFVIGAEFSTPTNGFGELDVAAVLVYDRELGDDEHADTVSYLRDKYFLSDPNPNPSTEGCPKTVLGVNESMTCTVTGIATADQYENLGTATGTTPVGDPVEPSEDLSHYFGADPSVTIEKATNGEDADEPIGPVLAVGSTAEFAYVVTNTGNVDLADVMVTDDQGVAVTCSRSGTNTIALLAVGASETCTGSTTVTPGQYANVGSVTGNPVDERGVDIPGAVDPTDDDKSHHFGQGAASIDIEKLTNGVDADEPTGPMLTVGSTANFEYVVRNTGDADLFDVMVTDDQGVTVTCPSSGTNTIALLAAINATETCTGSTTVTAGQYRNLATATAKAPDGSTPSDSDYSHHFGQGAAGIAIKKFTNGVDAGNPTDTGPRIPVGEEVVWTYVVTNDGDLPLIDVTVDDSPNGLVPSANGLPVTDGLVVRLESDSGITEDAGTGAVMGWASNGGTGLVLEASGGPTLGTTPNGQPAIKLDGVDDKLESAAGDANLDGLPAGNAARTLYFVADYKAANGVAVGATYGAGALNQAFCLVVDHNTDRLAVQGFGGANDFTAPVQNAIGDNDGSIGDDWFVHSVRYDGQTILHYRDGVLIDTVPHEFDTMVEKFLIGAEVSTPPRGFGELDVAAVLVYDKVLSEDEDAETVAYLTRKYLTGCPQSELAVNESMTCTVFGTAVLGQYENEGKATGTPPTGVAVEDRDLSHYFGFGRPSIDIRKWAEDGPDGPDGDAFPPGSEVPFKIVVTNNGDVTLTDIVVTDVKAPECGADIDELMPNAEFEINCSTVLAGGDSKEFRDDFRPSASYTGNDGRDRWSGPWLEEDSAGGGASSGDVLVGSNEKLWLRNPSLRSNPWPSARRTADLTGAASATLSFEWETHAGVDTSDQVVLEISDDDGATYTVLKTFTGFKGPKPRTDESFDISAYVSSQTTIRFRIADDYDGTDETFKVDNVTITTQGSAEGFVNEACVTGHFGQEPVGDCDSYRVDVLEAPRPSIDIRKQGEGDDYRNFAPGDTVPFHIKVTNDGNVLLKNVVVTDEATPDCNKYIGDLAPNADVKFDCHTILAGDVSREFRDDFRPSASYSGNDGSDLWSTNWIEEDTAGDGPKVGNVLVGSNEKLWLRNRPETSGAWPSARRSANLEGATSALLTFDWETHAGVDKSDRAVVEISADGGATYTVLKTFTGFSGAQRSTFERFDISAWISAQTTVRFRIARYYRAANETFKVDNVTITTEGFAEGFVNEACATGHAGGTPVGDCDTSTVLVRH